MASNTKQTRHDKLAGRVAKLVSEGKPFGVIDARLKLPPGTTYRINIRNEVAANPKLRINWRTDGQLLSRIQTARMRRDEYSSWHWLAGRTGVSVGKLKRLAREAGMETDERGR